MSELPPDWRTLTVAQLRRWLQDSPYRMPYLIYARKQHVIQWIEKNVERQRRRCPTCGQPI